MAKASSTTAAAAALAAANPSLPKITFGAPPAAIERKVGVAASPLTELMLSMPLPQGDKYASFFVPADEPAASITDTAERAKATKENARKLSNSLSGLSRRLAKKHADKHFVLRTVEDEGKLGVRVYRVAVPGTVRHAPAADAVTVTV